MRITEQTEGRAAVNPDPEMEEMRGYVSEVMADRKAAFLQAVDAERRTTGQELTGGEHVCGTPFVIVSCPNVLARLRAAHEVLVEEMMPGYWSVDLADFEVAA